MGPDISRITAVSCSFALSLALTVCRSIASEESTIPDQAKQASEKNLSADPFDFEKSEGDKNSPQEFIETDDSIKLTLEPLSHSAVVDRVLEPSTTIKVKAPGAVKVDVFIEAVDSPYCGKSISEPRLIGSSKDWRASFPIVWDSPESDRYVKIYAKAYKGNGSSSRSKSRDLAIGGLRFQAQK